MKVCGMWNKLDQPDYGRRKFKLGFEVDGGINESKMRKDSCKKEYKTGEQQQEYSAGSK